MGVIVKHYIQFEDYLKLSLTDDTANVTLFDVDLELGQYRTPGQLIGALLADREWTKRVLAIVLDVDEAVVTRMGERQAGHRRADGAEAVRGLRRPR